MADKLSQFQSQNYLTIETFRKNGAGVKTPVWFAQDGETLFIWTQADSGKVKRIRLNPDVKVVPAKADGTPLGEWVPAKTCSDDSPEVIRHITKLMRKKYGFSFTMFRLMGMLRRDKHTSLRIRVTG